MKALLVTPVPGEDLPLVCPVADSAIARDNMPLFLPQFTDKWLGSVCLAFRIVRLGKGISKRFVARYIDGMSLLYLLSVKDDESTRPFIMSGASYVMDGTLTYGKWLPFDPACGKYSVKVGETTMDVPFENTRVDEMVSGFSRIATVKSGDIFVLPQISIDVPPVLGTRVEAWLNGEKCLSLKIR